MKPEGVMCFIGALVTDEIERGNAIVIAGDSFAVDDAGARAKAGQRFDNQREATGEARPPRAATPPRRREA
jgi:hypothetical protein